MTLFSIIFWPFKLQTKISPAFLVAQKSSGGPVPYNAQFEVTHSRLPGLVTGSQSISGSSANFIAKTKAADGIFLFILDWGCLKGCVVIGDSHHSLREAPCRPAFIPWLPARPANRLASVSAKGHTKWQQSQSVCGSGLGCHPPGCPFHFKAFHDPRKITR